MHAYAQEIRRLKMHETHGPHCCLALFGGPSVAFGIPSDPRTLFRIQKPRLKSYPCLHKRLITSQYLY